ncbi:hypothetical protein E4T80_11845 [Muribacter muris]|uniref:Tetratricopeptide repeat protein n=1 Tax=Muribacter muris TaxID=67855 RepID=A0A4Y9JTH6_9PAST|nr:hypothetical protein [Muribacter muris]MBF0786152.1 hypothetical protein [Muribacter muris]MBF0827181.1 hypothetical protein [Muribacter muris]TFV07795.1 hypothetical protein E4T80_11845 [Muribacter muris]
MKHLKSIMIATVLALGSFSAIAQTAENIFNQAQTISDEAESLRKESVRYQNWGWRILDQDKFDRAQSLYEESFKLYEEARQQGNIEAENALLKHKLDLAVVFVDLKQCIQAKPLLNDLLAESSENANPLLKAQAIGYIGNLYVSGTCFRKDVSKGVKLFGQSCDLGSWHGCNRYNEFDKNK